MSFFFSLLLYWSVVPLDLHSFLHDALPISRNRLRGACQQRLRAMEPAAAHHCGPGAFREKSCHAESETRAIWLGGNRQKDRKSTRLNSSHVSISYAVFCLKKKTKRTPLKDP